MPTITGCEPVEISPGTTFSPIRFAGPFSGAAHEDYFKFDAVPGHMKNRWVDDGKHEARHLMVSVSIRPAILVIITIE